MKRLLTLTAAAAALTAGLAWAATETAPYGAQFMQEWDLDADGQVTLAEAKERRGDIFYMFDSDEDGTLTSAEYAAFDKHRAEDARTMHGAEMGQGMGYGQGHGMGQGQGMAQGRGQNAGQGMGQGEPGYIRVHAAMEKGFNDVDGDGAVTADEFVSTTAAWFERMDSNGDGVLTPADFGPRRG